VTHQSRQPPSTPLHLFVRTTAATATRHHHVRTISAAATVTILLVGNSTTTPSPAPPRLHMLISRNLHTNLAGVRSSAVTHNNYVRNSSEHHHAAATSAPLHHAPAAATTRPSSIDEPDSQPPLQPPRTPEKHHLHCRFASANINDNTRIRSRHCHPRWQPRATRTTTTTANTTTSSEPDRAVTPSWQHLHAIPATFRTSHGHAGKRCWSKATVNHHAVSIAGEEVELVTSSVAPSRIAKGGRRV